MTPQEHLTHAEQIAADLEARASSLIAAHPETAIRLATLHVSLALAINAIPLLGKAADSLRRIRSEDAVDRFLDDPSTGTRRPHAGWRDSPEIPRFGADENNLDDEVE
jgi:hypothetical protein